MAVVWVGSGSFPAVSDFIGVSSNLVNSIELRSQVENLAQNQPSNEDRSYLEKQIAILRKTGAKLIEDAEGGRGRASDPSSVLAEALLAPA